MSRILVGSLVLLLLVLPGCKKPKARAGSGSASGPVTAAPKDPAPGKNPAPGKDPAPGKAPAKASSGCVLEAAIKADVTLTKGCTVPVKESVTIDEGATLTIEAGVKLLFEADTFLWVTKGKVVVRGTAEAPVTFTSAAKTPAASDWVGLVFDDKASAGNAIDHAIVEYAGKAASSGVGAISIRGVAPGRIAITHTTIRKNGQAGIAADSEKFAFAKFEGNTLADNAGTSLKLSSNILGSVGMGNKLGDPVHIEGNVTTTQRWVALDVPIIVSGGVNIGGEKSAAVLTLAEKSTLKFTMSSFLWIGTEQGGGLVAKGVTFTSANKPAAAGDWIGLFFDAKTTATVLEGCTIEYAGRAENGGGGAITFRGLEANGVKISKLVMKDNKQAGFAGLEGKCGSLVEAASGNTSAGVPICAKPE